MRQSRPMGVKIFQDENGVFIVSYNNDNHSHKKDQS